MSSTALPCIAAIAAAVDAIERARYQHAGIAFIQGMARIDLPCMAGSVSQLWPPSLLRKISPTCWLAKLHAET